MSDADVLPVDQQDVEKLRAHIAHLDEELRQRDLLMREVNHRVANSLQLASSILRMQSHQETDQHTRDQLEKAGQRISSIQHVHDRLYRSGDMRSIELSQYLRDLCQGLADSMMQDEDSRRCTVTTECERMRIATDMVSKLGLVVNEFVTNAFKHGDSGRERTVRVVAHDDGGVLHLEVRDNGPGLPDGFNIARIKGLGMRLVRFVSSSLGGEVGARSEGSGAVFFVRLPLPQPEAH